VNIFYCCSVVLFEQNISFDLAFDLVIFKQSSLQKQMLSVADLIQPIFLFLFLRQHSISDIC
jgi:hypothetical protein